ncbi:acyl-CoA Delta(11) desaturase-like [Anticarsia gemmatalis]|uniref:acyl-CoA Delta(11) desaturase-like n=1 Tax=Anticarsia gemmatalis TaxID=129554 RepID=UPI003F760759
MDRPDKLLKWDLNWANVAPVATLHVLFPYAVYLAFTSAMWSTLLFAWFTYCISLVGQTAGVHRLWSHRAYKAKQPLQILLLALSTITFQGSVIHWARDHRLHHKYSDTDADPHNAKRGFFYSHIGWALMKKPTEVVSQGRLISMKDLQSQPLLYFQNKYYIPLALLFCFGFPSIVPLLWGEKFWTAFFVASVLRLVLSQHATFSINSAAHIWGMKPYDKDILPTECLALSMVMCGEGFHNFHHAFPWDYRAGEFGGYSLNFSWYFIDLMAKIGWAYDLKAVSDGDIEKRVNRSGDGSHPVWNVKDHDLDAIYTQSTKKFTPLRARGV